MVQKVLDINLAMGKYLLDAVVIRPLIIGIVVIYHAFIIYNGGWEEPVGFHKMVWMDC